MKDTVYSSRRGALIVGVHGAADLPSALSAARREAAEGRVPPPGTLPNAAALEANERVAIDFDDATDLVGKLERAEKAARSAAPAAWKAVRAQGVIRGSGPPGKVAFLFPGQGSQYPNMLASLRAREPVVEAAFAEASEELLGALGGPLLDRIFADPSDPSALAAVEASLQKSAVSQPAVVAADVAMSRLLAGRGFVPDMVMGHSLGEYAALVAAGALPFRDALEGVAVRGSKLSAPGDPGRMAAVTAPVEETRRVLATLEGYVVIANLNSHHQCVIGGASDAVDRAVAALGAAGYEAAVLPVTHAFHTEVVRASTDHLRRVFSRLDFEPPRIPVIANMTGEPYPAERAAIVDMLARQAAAPVDFVKGLRALHALGARVFVEVGPRKVLHGFAEDVLGALPDVSVLFTNHPKIEDEVALHRAICGLYAAGIRPRPGAAPLEAPCLRTIEDPPVRSLQITLPPAREGR